MRKLKYCFGVMALGMVLLAACGKRPTTDPLPTLAPQATEEPEATATPEPTPKPTPTKKPTPTPMGTNLPEGINLRNTYGKTFGHIGTCLNASQLSDLSVWKLLDENYNSITMENEMKPDALLGGSAKLISVEAAKELGYVIPENYTDSMVPELRFYYTDRALEFCETHDLGLRGHTLVWHSQTPTWFFREDYKAGGEFVSPEVMDARMEFFIRTVMGHVYDHEYGNRLYSWDVVNEYLHAENSGWEAVYGKEGVTPSFVKKAFDIADDVLRQYGIRESVSLLYNDFQTHSITVPILNMLEFINAEEKLCDGVGMQSHLSESSPPAVAYVITVQKFLDAGHEVHITELDVGNKNDLMQASYLYSIMEKLIKLKKEGAAINGITYWGVSDMNSWRPGENALLYKNIRTPKLSYYKVLEAYVDAGLYTEE